MSCPYRSSTVVSLPAESFPHFRDRNRDVFMCNNEIEPSHIAHASENMPYETAAKTCRRRPHFCIREKREMENEGKNARILARRRGIPSLGRPPIGLANAGIIHRLRRRRPKRSGRKCCAITIGIALHNIIQVSRVQMSRNSQ